MSQMQIKGIFSKPLDRAINGVVKADQNDDATVYQELEEYVVTNELDKHFRAFFDSYSTDLSDPSIANRVGVWISGFFGSGKSHFLKTLSYILANKAAVNPQGQHKLAIDFFDEEKIRDALIRSDMTKAVANSADVILFNIDSKASAGDSGNKILSVFLRVFNEHQGFSGDHPHIAHMERYLTEKGAYAAFQDAFRASAGSDWIAERDGYHFYQDDIEAALSSALGMSAESAKKWFEESEHTFDVSVESFCNWVKDYLATQAESHRVLFLVDEVGQFIGSDTQLMLTLQTITENLGTICQGRAWIIVTSQADMDAVLGELSSSKANDFSKIAGRFKTRLSLSSSNTDEVIQRRLLLKTPAAAEELKDVFEAKGDILKNQLTFDRSGPTLKNFDGPDSFVANYPFAPYHFQLVQKVFEEIRKVGASGAHLAYGERSMLDAFQMAANSISSENIGALIPMYRFYDSVEGFLDTAVKRTIDNAADDVTLDQVDVNILRTLFMIRYVDLVKGTLDNLVTLSIEQIDDDKLGLRKRIEGSLQRLEKQSLITRSGDEFVFLTNEERDITQKIKATDIASSDENRELSNLIYKESLRDQSKYRHVANKMDYSVGRYLDGHSLDGRYEADLRLEIISPLDVDYALYSEARCITKSLENDGMALLKLPDDQQFFSELRTWLKTNQYIRLNVDPSQSDITRILADRGRENQERRKRLRASLDAMLADAQIYALGQHLDVTATSISAKYDDACKYLLENTYSKLSYLKFLQQDPYRELSAVLSADDIAQIGLTLDGEQGNPQATHEVDEYLALRTSGTERTLISDVVDRFSKRPFGWPDAEILLIVGRLTVAGKISLQAAGATLPAGDAFELLQNSRRRKEVSVTRKRQTDEAILKQAQKLTNELFSTLGPATEKELYKFCCGHLSDWRDNLSSYQSKAEVSQLPGQDVIRQRLLDLNRLLSNNDSFDFFTELVGSKTELLNLEEDYRDIHEFFTTQMQTWRQLLDALRRFSSNETALVKNDDARDALAQLREIECATSPYSRLHTVLNMISTIDEVNTRLVQEKREHAEAGLNEKIAQLTAEIQKSGVATADLSNKLLMPLQRIKADVGQETAIASIYMLQEEQGGEAFEEALQYLQEAVQAASPTAASGAEEPASGPATVNEGGQPVYQPVPKTSISLSISECLSQAGVSVFVETEVEAEAFLTILREQLVSALNDKKKVRIR
jgi:hypothetical protein